MSLFAFFAIHSVVRRDSKIHETACFPSFLLIASKFARLASFRWFVWISKFQKVSWVSFFRTDSDLCISFFFFSMIKFQFLAQSSLCTVQQTRSSWTLSIRRATPWCDPFLKNYGNETSLYSLRNLRYENLRFFQYPPEGSAEISERLGWMQIWWWRYGSLETSLCSDKKRTPNFLG